MLLLGNQLRSVHSNPRPSETPRLGARGAQIHTVEERKLRKELEHV